VVGVGIALPFVAARLAELMGWKQTFVGTLLIVGITSLPELVVSVAAVRIGAIELAMADLLGSNLFNMVVIAVDDLLYPKGPLLSHVSPVHAVQ